MKQSLVNKLLQLNREFYEQHANDFSRTRQMPWPGWELLWKNFEQEQWRPRRILDVGCGNGRFLKFLLERMAATDVDYIGIDSSQALLDICRQQFSTFANSFLLLDITGENWPDLGKFDLIVVFGVMHHIPGQENRLKLLQKLTEMLNPAGRLAVNFWSDQAKIAEKHRQKLTSGEVGDYLLTWGDSKDYLRYCHFSNSQETNDIIGNLTSLQLTADFYADSANTKANHYLLFKRV